MLLQELRIATASAHKQLEQSLALQSQAFTLGHYKNLLLAWYKVLQTLEPRVWDHEEWRKLGVETTARRRAKLLFSDLQFFNLIPSLRPEAPIDTQFGEFPKSFAAALGCAYVLEGSTLGGQLIVKTAAHRWNLHPGAGATFFAGHGSDTGRLWRNFLAGLEQWDTKNPKNATAVTDAGRRTFQIFETQLSKSICNLHPSKVAR